MSMVIFDKIEQIKEPYLYKKITDYISKNVNKMNLLKYYDSSKQKIFNEIEKVMNVFANKNGIELNDDKNILSRIYKNLDNIINWLKNLNSNLIRKEQLEILRNLLFSKKDKEIISNFNDLINVNENGNIFTINDFIFKYTLESINIIFNDTFGNQESAKLNNIYLYLIFQINEPDFIIKLKILIYEYLYGKKDINKFIFSTSENIVKKENFDNKTLKIMEIKNNEFDDIIISEVSKNIISFFDDKAKDINDIYNFFTPNNIENNLKKTESKEIKPQFIVIDDLKYDNNKIHLFSPEFLISNGFKSKIELNDFEIFNKDNYSVDLFAKFLTQIIKEFNESLKENNFPNDFLKNNLIKFHQMDFFHYISAKLDYNDTNKQNIFENDSNEINVDKNEKTEKINIKEDENYFPDDKIRKNSSLLQSLKFDLEETNSRYYHFKSILNNVLIDKIKKKNLLVLPNILFMLNLKIPTLDEENNLLDFKSVHLNFFKKNNIWDISNYYGCKEIDGLFENISENQYNVLDSKLFNYNCICLKKKEENKFSLVDKSDFSINPKSVLFCKIKIYFPNKKNGKENFLNLDVEQLPKTIDYSIDYIDEINPLYSYYVELDQFIRNLKYFFNICKDKRNNEKELNIHIFFLYDVYNMNIGVSFTKVKDLTLATLNNNIWRFKNIGNIIFQMVVFDVVELDRELERIIEEQKIILNGLNKKIQKQEKEIKKKEKEELDIFIDKIIKEKGNKLGEFLKLIKESKMTDEEKKEKLEEFLFGTKLP